MVPINTVIGPYFLSKKAKKNQLIILILKKIYAKLKLYKKLSLVAIN